MASDESAFIRLTRMNHVAKLLLLGHSCLPVQLQIEHMCSLKAHSSHRLQISS